MTLKLRVQKVSLFACACVIALAQPAWSQTPMGCATLGIPGYLDPQTRTFIPMSQSSVEGAETAAAITPTTGTFIVAFTITILPSIPTSDTILCGVSAIVLDQGSGLSFVGSAGAPATRSGSMAKCTATLPYSWALSSPDTDTVSLSWGIGTCQTCGKPNRSTSGTLGSTEVPASGSTTQSSVKVTF
jgi:hypothetical protein